jgi:phenylalanyl-tRNA synthetase beta chain
MRTTLLGSLLDIARRNRARGAERVALFESGRVYLPEAEPTGGALGGAFAGEQAPPVTEPHRIGCLASGPLTPKSWRGGGEPADFFALKGVLEGLAERLAARVGFEPGEHPFLHPGRSAKVIVDGADIGWLGELHPLVCREWDLDGAAGFELDLAPLLAAAGAGAETFEDVTTYPAVLQDLAVVVPEDVSAARVREAVLAGGGELLRSAEVFDLYEGEQVGEGRKSLALRLEFRAADRTLTDEEVSGHREAIAAALAEIGGSPRE